MQYFTTKKLKRSFTTACAFTVMLMTVNDSVASDSCASFQSDPNAPKSNWVTLQSDGSLKYSQLDTAYGYNNEQISDFSSAGYAGGGVALPNSEKEYGYENGFGLKKISSSTAFSERIQPSGGDDTDTIQRAIDDVYKLDADQNGIRGVVLLGAGNFQLNSNTIALKSGVILRGSGTNSKDTVLNVNGSARTIFTIAGIASTRRTYPKNSTKITDSLITSGSSTFHVENTSVFNVGDEVLLRRTITQAWIDEMGMNLVRDGELQTWLDAGDTIEADRIITGIDSKMKTITLDAPISDTYDSTASPNIIKYSFSGRLEKAGIESIRVTVPKGEGPQYSGNYYQFIDISSAKDVWIKDIVAEEVTNGIKIDGRTKRVTIDKTTLFRTSAVDKSQGSPAHFSSYGQQILIMRSSSKAGNNNVLPFATQSRTPGPTVVLDMQATTPLSVQPHQRWATGLLIDNAVVGELIGNTKVGYGGIELVNLGNQGSGHGWTIGWSVVWNSSAGYQIVQQPPNSMNWSIGTIASTTKKAHFVEKLGAYESIGTHVSPRSLYLQQLCQRAGYDAVKAIGY